MIGVSKLFPTLGPFTLVLRLSLVMHAYTYMRVEFIFKSQEGS